MATSLAEPRGNRTGSRAPGPPAIPLIGNALAFRRDPIAFLRALARDYGDLVAFRIGTHRFFLINHPDYIREILITRQTNFTKSLALQRTKPLLGEGLLTSEGQHHLRERRLVQPAFHRERLQSYAAIMTEYALEWRATFLARRDFDMLQKMTGLSLAIVSKALFRADLERNAQSVSKAMTDVVELFRIVMLPFGDFLNRLLPSRRRLDRAIAVVKQTVDNIIREHRALAPEKRADSCDLLSALLAARDQDGSSLTDEQLRDEILTLFVAGHETTAIALTWSWYLLAQHPECEARLHDEIDSVLAGRTPTFEDLPRLAYTEGVAAEALRLYPPVWVIGRIAKEKFELAGLRLPKGAVCVISPYLMHRDPRFYENPDRFDPGRWRPELRDAHPKFSFIPFGGGARVCIGERFAWSAMILVIATLAQKWRFRMADGEPVVAAPRVTLRPSGPVRMLAVPR